MNLLTEIRKNEITSFADESVMNEYDEERALETAGFSQVLNRNKRNRTELELLKKFGPLVKYSDLVSVAKKYHLSIRPSSQFKGDPGPNTAKRVSEFQKRHGKLEPKRFFVMGLPEHFEKPISLDPVLLYCVDDAIPFDYEAGMPSAAPGLWRGVYDGKMFAIIDQWGGDLNRWRILKSIFHHHPHLGVTLLGLVVAGALAFINPIAGLVAFVAIPVVSLWVAVWQG